MIRRLLLSDTTDNRSILEEARSFSSKFISPFPEMARSSLFYKRASHSPSRCLGGMRRNLGLTVNRINDYGKSVDSRDTAIRPQAAFHREEKIDEASTDRPG